MAAHSMELSSVLHTLLPAPRSAQVYAAWAAGVALTVGNIVALIMWGAGLW